MSVANVDLKQLRLDTRQLKAFEMVSADSAIRKIRKGNYLVKSQTSEKYYQVRSRDQAGPVIVRITPTIKLSVNTSTLCNLKNDKKLD